VFLGADSALEGELNFSGQARLDGRFSGRIQGTGTLMVGPTAQVKADIEADTVIISGEVIGAVVAGERIELKAPGKLRGDINAPLVVMDEGVQFEGHCSMAGGERQERVPKITLLASGEK
jgi:cytoskeletal protein CcmA (bactofilin family)